MMLKIAPILQNNEIVQYDFKNLKIGIAMSSLLYHIPITELESDANAQIHCDWPGTWNFEKLHFELKYFGKNPADARLKETIRVDEIHIPYMYHF